MSTYTSSINFCFVHMDPPTAPVLDPDMAHQFKMEKAERMKAEEALFEDLDLETETRTEWISPYQDFSKKETSVGTTPPSSPPKDSTTADEAATPSKAAALQTVESGCDPIPPEELGITAAPQLPTFLPSKPTSREDPLESTTDSDFTLAEGSMSRSEAGATFYLENSSSQSSPPKGILRRDSSVVEESNIDDNPDVTTDATTPKKKKSVIINAPEGSKEKPQRIKKSEVAEEEPVEDHRQAIEFEDADDPNSDPKFLVSKLQHKVYFKHNLPDIPPATDPGQAPYYVGLYERHEASVSSKEAESVCEEIVKASYEMYVLGGIVESEDNLSTFNSTKQTRSVQLASLFAKEGATAGRQSAAQVNAGPQGTFDNRLFGTNEVFQNLLDTCSHTSTWESRKHHVKEFAGSIFKRVLSVTSGHLAHPTLKEVAGFKRLHGTSSSYISLKEGLYVHVWSNSSQARRFAASNKHVWQTLADNGLGMITSTVGGMVTYRGALATVTQLVPLLSTEQIYFSGAPSSSSSSTSSSDSSSSFTTTVFPKESILHSFYEQLMLLLADGGNGSYSTETNPNFNSTQPLGAAANIPLYKGADGRYYIISVDGILPYQFKAPSGDSSFEARPEIHHLLAAKRRPGRMGGPGLTRQEVKKFILQEQVPKAAKRILEDLIENPNLSEYAQSYGVSNALHEHGVNMQFLFHVLASPELQGDGSNKEAAGAAAQAVLNEMGLRTLKEMVRADLRGKRDELDSVAVGRVNRLLTLCLLDRSGVWNHQVMPVLRRKFGCPDDFRVPLSPSLMKSISTRFNNKMGILFNTESMNFERLQGITCTFFFFGLPKFVTQAVTARAKNGGSISLGKRKPTALVKGHSRSQLLLQKESRKKMVVKQPSDHEGQQENVVEKKEDPLNNEDNEELYGDIPRVLSSENFGQLENSTRVSPQNGLESSDDGTASDDDGEEAPQSKTSSLHRKESIAFLEDPSAISQLDAGSQLLRTSTLAVLNRRHAAGEVKERVLKLAQDSLGKTPPPKGKQTSAAVAAASRVALVRSVLLELLRALRVCVFLGSEEDGSILAKELFHEVNELLPPPWYDEDFGDPKSEGSTVSDRMLPKEQLGCERLTFLSAILDLRVPATAVEVEHEVAQSLKALFPHVTSTSVDDEANDGNNEKEDDDDHSISSNEENQCLTLLERGLLDPIRVLPQNLIICVDGWFLATRYRVLSHPEKFAREYAKNSSSSQSVGGGAAPSLPPEDLKNMLYSLSLGEKVNWVDKIAPYWWLEFLLQRITTRSVVDESEAIAFLSKKVMKITANARECLDEMKHNAVLVNIRKVTAALVNSQDEVACTNLREVAMFSLRMHEEKFGQGAYQSGVGLSQAVYVCAVSVLKKMTKDQQREVRNFHKLTQNFGSLTVRELRKTLASQEYLSSLGAMTQILAQMKIPGGIAARMMHHSLAFNRQGSEIEANVKNSARILHFRAYRRITNYVRKWKGLMPHRDQEQEEMWHRQGIAFVEWEISTRVLPFLAIEANEEAARDATDTEMVQLSLNLHLDFQKLMAKEHERLARLEQDDLHDSERRAIDAEEEALRQVLINIQLYEFESLLEDCETEGKRIQEELMEKQHLFERQLIELHEEAVSRIDVEAEEDYQFQVVILSHDSEERQGLPYLFSLLTLEATDEVFARDSLIDEVERFWESVCDPLSKELATYHTIEALERDARPLVGDHASLVLNATHRAFFIELERSNRDIILSKEEGPRREILQLFDETKPKPIMIDARERAKIFAARLTEMEAAQIETEVQELNSKVDEIFDEVRKEEFLEWNQIKSQLEQSNREAIILAKRRVNEEAVFKQESLREERERARQAATAYRERVEEQRERARVAREKYLVETQKGVSGDQATTTHRRRSSLSRLSPPPQYDEEEDSAWNEPSAATTETSKERVEARAREQKQKRFLIKVAQFNEQELKRRRVIEIDARTSGSELQIQCQEGCVAIQRKEKLKNKMLKSGTGHTASSAGVRDRNEEFMAEQLVSLNALQTKEKTEWLAICSTFRRGPESLENSLSFSVFSPSQSASGMARSTSKKTVQSTSNADSRRNRSRSPIGDDSTPASPLSRSQSSPSVGRSRIDHQEGSGASIPSPRKAESKSAGNSPTPAVSFKKVSKTTTTGGGNSGSLRRAGSRRISVEERRALIQDAREGHEKEKSKSTDSFLAKKTQQPVSRNAKQ